MSGEFEIVHEGELPGTPEQVWQAITKGTGGWLWPLEYEEREGGAGPFDGLVRVWEPPHHLVARSEGEAGWFNELDYLIEARPNGRAWIRYVHSGVLAEDWDNQYDQAKKHTRFYLHTLGQYIEHFLGRPVAYAVNEPEGAQAKDAFDVFARKLGLADAAGEGARVSFDVPGIGRQDAVVNFRDPNFLGLRTSDALICIFGRNAWGGSVGYAVHDFSEKRDSEALTKAWDAWFATAV